LKRIYSPVFNNTGLWLGHMTRMTERKLVYRILVGKREGKRSLGGHRRRWENNIKIDLQENRMRGRGLH